jgi:RsiW-degrading membrane proteinase PrsW (M82 family)
MNTQPREILYLAGSPLLRPRVGKLAVLLLAVLLLVASLSFVSTFDRLPESGAIGVYLLALLISTLLSLPVVVLLWYLDRREREPIWLFFGAILWGAVVAIGLSLLLYGTSPNLTTAFLQDDLGGLNALDPSTSDPGRWIDPLFSFSTLSVSMLTRPFMEELTKGLALLVILWLLRSEFNGLRDGIIYGALVGLGFNLTETALSAAGQGFYQGGAIEFARQFVGRFALLGFDGHTLYTALFGLGLGLAVQAHRLISKILYGLGSFFMAVMAHFLSSLVSSPVAGFYLWLIQSPQTGNFNPNSFSFENFGLLTTWLVQALTRLTLQLFPLLLLIVAVVQSGQWEQRIFQEQLADEIGQAITPDEYADLCTENYFGLRQIANYPKRISNAIVNAQNKLALRKLTVLQAGKDPMTDRLAQVWRDRITHLRQVGIAGVDE